MEGVLDLIRAVDEFILLEDVQYTRRDWRNRNLIKTTDGLRWLSIPVKVKGLRDQRIRDVAIDGPAWAAQHWRAIERSYARAAAFRRFRDQISAAYQRAGREPTLSGVNHVLLVSLCRALGIDTPIRSSVDYRDVEGRTARLVSLCQQAGATEYLSGPSARDYIDEAAFDRAGIRLRFVDYRGYPPYPQLYPPFVHGVSALDLLFNAGDGRASFLLDFRSNAR